MNRRRLMIIAAVLVGCVGVLYGAVWFYAAVINDAPDALDADDLDAALAATTVATTAAPAPSTTAATSAAPDATTTTATAADPATDTSQWQIAEGSELGYRVAEVLFGVDTEGVGRTGEVTGGITIESTTMTAASFEVDVASITSDDGRRDGQFRGRIMETDRFPTASFELSEPVELGVEATEGAEVTVEITGDLTMHGVTRPVTFDVTARITGGRLGVLGSIPVVFTDFDIADPSLPAIRVEPDGLIEFVLVLTPA
jgi:polyisoprenoid-binding protein YceI